MMAATYWPTNSAPSRAWPDNYWPLIDDSVPPLGTVALSDTAIGGLMASDAAVGGVTVTDTIR